MFSHVNLTLLLILTIVITRSHSLRVQQLKEINKDATSITIEWSVYDDDQVMVPSATLASLLSGENEWIGFKIKYFTDKLQYTPVLLKNANLRKFRLDNLKSNTDYKVQVSAFSSGGLEGPASNLITIRTHEAGLYFDTFSSKLHGPIKVQLGPNGSENIKLTRKNGISSLMVTVFLALLVLSTG